MEPDWQQDRVTAMSKTMRRQQRGMTVLGFIIMAAVVSVLLFAVLKITPIYLQNKRIEAVLQDMKAELDGTGTTANRVRLSMIRRLDIEMIKLPMDAVKISKSRNGYTVRVKYDNRTHYIADIWLVVALDKQVEIIR